MRSAALGTRPHDQVKRSNFKQVNVSTGLRAIDVGLCFALTGVSYGAVCGVIVGVCMCTLRGGRK